VSALLDGFPPSVLSLAYLVSATLFITGLRELSHPRTAARGNTVSSVGMVLAVGITVLWFDILSPLVLLAALVVGTAVGVWLATTVETTQMPQLVGLFNGLGGGASVLVAGAELVSRAGSAETAALQSSVVTAAAATTGLIGAVTFCGSLVAAGKLHGLSEHPVHYAGERVLKPLVALVAVGAGVVLVLQPAAVGPVVRADWVPAYWTLVLAAALLGVLLVVPIGGADMPVVIALLNACSGLAAATTGFVLDNSILIIAGTLVGASGMILTRIMCRAMNRSLGNVLFSGYADVARRSDDADDPYEGRVMSTSPEEVEMLLDAARRVVIVPGYGMAVGQAQHAIAELARLLAANGVDVAFGIHPVAGRMPGHMNVLLAEANVPYEQLRELEAVNPTFAETDLVLVVGANDVVNPAALTDESSPIAGMPVLHVWEAETVVVSKRSLSPGYAGIPNPLFTRGNTYMLFGDAKETMQALVTEYEERHSR
jgi:NAD(P) transhydrogenase subunit beta